MRRLFLVMAVWIAALALAPAVARERPAFKDTNPPMRVLIVRSAEPGCEPFCAEWISAQGRITAGTPGEFRRALKKLGARQLPVFIHSGGGLVPAALEIGRMLRERKIDIHVAGTFLESCVPGDRTCVARSKSDAPLGEPASLNAQCASACSFILAAGTQRLVPLLGLVGVHRATAFRTRVNVLRKYRVTWKLVNGRKVETSRTLVSETEVSRRTTRIEAPESANRDVAKYFAAMGVSTTLLALIAATPASDIHWLSADELLSTGLATARGGGGAYVAATHAAGRATRQAALNASAPAPAKPPADIAAPAPTLLPEGPQDQPAARAAARLGPFDDRFITLDMRFRRNAMADAISVEIGAALDGAPTPTRPLTLYFDLPGAKSFAALNARADDENAALGALIPRLDFCELLFDPWTTLRLENRDGGTTALQVQLFRTGELKDSGLCPLWRQNEAAN